MARSPPAIVLAGGDGMCGPDQGASRLTSVNAVGLARRQPLAGGASVGLLAAIVLGLMAMHSLSMPESGSHHEAGTSLSVASPLTPDPAGEERLLAGHGPTPGGHLFALCGVMLAASAAAAVAWLVRRRERRHPAPPLALRDVPGASPPRRPRAGPPRYLTLSVCRS